MGLIEAIKQRCSFKKSTGCHIWQLATDKDGYPRMTYRNKGYLPTREILANKLGRPVEGWALHTCDTPRCCNEDHLYEGTVKDNARDMIERGRGKNQFLAGSKHPKSKLTEDQAKEIRDTPKVLGSGMMLAKKFGVSKSTISQIRSGQSRAQSIFPPAS